MRTIKILFPLVCDFREKTDLTNLRPTNTKRMKSSIDSAPATQRAHKFDRTHRFSKQHTQGAAILKNSVNSNKSITRLNENPQVQKSKTGVAQNSQRAGSIPKVMVKEQREFGREINQNSATAMQSVAQMSGGLIIQGKLKPNVSKPNPIMKAFAPNSNSSLLRDQ